jgi:hypothetical protein
MPTACSVSGPPEILRSPLQIDAVARAKPLERFRAKWVPVRVKKTRQNKNLEPRSDSIGTEKALDQFDRPKTSLATASGFMKLARLRLTRTETLLESRLI